MEKINKKQFLTIKQAAITYPAFTESSFRWLLFNANQNGFKKCVRRIGRRVLIDVEIFEDWVNEK